MEKYSNENNMPDVDNLDLTAQTDDLDLFSEELEDRFNADLGSTLGSASTAVSCWGTASSLCTFL